jgi:hypothetical protein
MKCVQVNTDIIGMVLVVSECESDGLVGLRHCCSQSLGSSRGTIVMVVLTDRNQLRGVSVFSDPFWSIKVDFLLLGTSDVDNFDNADQSELENLTKIALVVNRRYSTDDH